MENICHTMLGGVLARSGASKLSPLATATVLVGASLPDIDILTFVLGNLAYLEYHRGVTHALAGLAVESLLLAGAMLLVDRFWRRRRPGGEPARFGGLVVAAALGLASHTLLDSTNSYGVRPWLPFDATWWYGDTVFVVDPWLWLLLGGPLFLGSRGDRGEMLFWALLFVCQGVFLAAAARFSPFPGLRPAVCLWVACAAVLASAHLLLRNPSAEKLARWSLILSLCYWLAMAGAHAMALDHARSLARALNVENASEVASYPIPLRPDRWQAVVMTETEVHLARIDLPGGAGPVTTVERNLELPEVRAALDSCPGQVARRFHRFLYAGVEKNEAGCAAVSFRDVRFPRRPGLGEFGLTRVALDSSLQPLPDNRYCPGE